MKYYVECDPQYFKFWAGAKDRMDDATEDQRQQVFERLAMLMKDGADWSETEVNDFVRFECDDIFFNDNEKEEQ